MHCMYGCLWMACPFCNLFYTGQFVIYLNIYNWTLPPFEKCLEKLCRCMGRIVGQTKSNMQNSKYKYHKLAAESRTKYTCIVALSRLTQWLDAKHTTNQKTPSNPLKTLTSRKGKKTIQSNERALATQTSRNDWFCAFFLEAYYCGWFIAFSAKYIRWLGENDKSRTKIVGERETANGRKQSP